VITQCSIRHLYKEGSDRSVQAAIEVAKNVCERRRCGHHPETHPEPLSTLECLSSIVDPDKARINKHKYVVATQEQEVRSAMRRIPGVPLIYVSRSVMILEPMSEATRRVCESGEKGKLRDGFVRNNDRKRKRGDEEEDEKNGSEAESGDEAGGPQDGEKKKKKKKKTYGPKQPNPLAVQKKKKKSADEGQSKATKPKDENKERNEGQAPAPTTAETGPEKGNAENKPKRKRRRKHKAAGDGDGDGVGENGSGMGADGGNEAAASAGGEAVQAEA
jgi:U3 small nucleolar RNA-associated protein 23